MEKIEVLLEKLDNRITTSLAKRLDSYEDLNDELSSIGQDYEKNPSDENRKKYNEIINSVEEIELGLIEDLEALIVKRKADDLAKQTPATPPVVETKVETPVTPPAKSEEKKEGSGVLTLVIGGVLLVASFGAINYFRKQ